MDSKSSSTAQTAVRGAESRWISILNEMIDTMVLIALFIFFFIGGYIIWDMQQVYDVARPEEYEQYKPVVPYTENFNDLQSINNEVIAWIELYGTTVDYPVVHADNNQKYLKTSPKGDYSLAGSIFLDYRNSPDFSDFNSIIHGHNMAHNVMFGDVADFKEAGFFKDHKYGNIFYGGKDHGIEILGYLTADVYTSQIYSPGLTEKWEQDYYMQLIEDQLIHRRREKIELKESDRLLILSTCVMTATNGRHILVCRITDKTYKNPFLNDSKGSNVDTVGDYRDELLLILISLLILALLIMIARRMRRSRIREERKASQVISLR